jgi:hypothetical protein
MRGVKGSGPNGKKARRGRGAGTTAVGVARQASSIEHDDTATCRLDGAALVSGGCPSCHACAQRFARIRELEAELRALKQRRCEICDAPGGRKSPKHPQVACPLCRKLLTHEARMKAQLAKAKGRT